MTPADREQEYEDFQDLITRPGWIRLMRYAARQYMGTGFRTAMIKVATDPVMTQATVLASQEIERLMRYPEERLRQLSTEGATS